MPHKKFFVLQLLVIDPRHPYISTKKSMKGILINLVNRQLSSKNLFSELNDHDIDHELHTEDTYKMS